VAEAVVGGGRRT